MRIVITGWALRSYMNLLHDGVFDRALFQDVIRPDVLRLRSWGDDVKFQDHRFWGPAESGANSRVPRGCKMKWHNLGTGRVQLRLYVALLDAAYLCHAGVKTSRQQDHRQGALLEGRIALIQRGNYTHEGEIG